MTALAALLGLDYGTMASLSHRANDHANDSKKFVSIGKAYPLLSEIVDLLYVMETKGHSVDDVLKDFSFSAPQQLKIRCGTLPPKQQAKEVIDYLMASTSVWDDGLDLPQLLANLGEPGTEVIKSELKALATAPQKYELFVPIPGFKRGVRQKIGYDNVFRVASYSEDQEFLPILDSIRQNPSVHAKIRHEAQLAYLNLKPDTNFRIAAILP